MHITFGRNIMWRYLQPLQKSETSKIIGKTNGSTSLEFAFVAPVFFLLFVGIFEVGAILLIQNSLETTVLQVSRFGRTGDVVAGETVEETASSLVQTYSFGLVDPSDLVLTVTPYASFSQIPALENAPDDGSQNFGTGDQVVLYTLSYRWNFFSVLIGRAMGVANIDLKASTIIVNEPF